MPGLASRWRLSRTGYYLDFFIVPALWLIVLGFAGELASYTANGFAFGFVLWTLAEYGIHRFAFHHGGELKREHLIHHRLPEDYIGVPPWQTVSALFIVWSVLWLALGQHLGSAITAGIVAGYFAYIVLHDAHHHRRRGLSYLRYTGRLHDIHHARNRVNFGVSSPLWDMAFGTYEYRWAPRKAA